MVNNFPQLDFSDLNYGRQKHKPLIYQIADRDGYAVDILHCKRKLLYLLQFCLIMFTKQLFCMEILYF